MTEPIAENVYETPALRDETRVFADRADAGRRLAELLAGADLVSGIVLGIPAGGVPVAAELAHRLGLPLDVAPVSKITLPWNTEAGYGAVAFDGTVRLNDPLLRSAGLDEATVESGIEATRRKVRRRMEKLRGDRPLPELADRTAVLVDDGLASGYTMQVAVEALRARGAGRIVVAVPTAPRRTVDRLAPGVDALYCLNIRTGASFAVADAYRHWRDLDEAEVAGILEDFGP